MRCASRATAVPAASTNASPPRFATAAASAARISATLRTAFTSGSGQADRVSSWRRLRTSSVALEDNGGAVGENLLERLTELVGVVPHRQNGVGAHGRGGFA